MTRYNTCPETAVSKAAKKLYPGMNLRFRIDANNDEQCDLTTLLSMIPGDDLTISDPRLGGRRAALNKAAEKAEARASREVNIEREPAQFVQLFEQYKDQELASIMPDIESVLIEKFTNLDPGKVYLLRTGKVDEGGHFHTLYHEGDCWMLDSGFKDGPSLNQSSSAEGSLPTRVPNIGVLYNDMTGELGPMSKSLLDISSDWGLTRGKRMLGIYEMNRERVLIAAHYLEKFRRLSPEDTQMVISKDYLSEIISQPHYLDGVGDYWHASGSDFSPVTPQEYIKIALEQCKRDLNGAVIQLEAHGYFENEDNAHQLLIEMIVLNNFDVVKEILNRNLINLTNPAIAEYIYKNAFLFSMGRLDCPPGLNQSLRILQNKLLEISPEQLPFTIHETCSTLNHDALQIMLTMNPEANRKELESVIRKTAQECESSPDTYLPIIGTLRGIQPKHSKAPTLHAQERLATEIPNPKPLESRHRTSFFSEEKPLKTRLREQKSQAYNEDQLASEILGVKARNASKTWEKARDILLNARNPSNPLGKEIEYSLTSKTGKEIKIRVSEQVQIAMDELYAKKLAEEEPNQRFRM